LSKTPTIRAISTGLRIPYVTTEMLQLIASGQQDSPHNMLAFLEQLQIKALDEVEHDILSSIPEQYEKGYQALMQLGSSRRQVEFIKRFIYRRDLQAIQLEQLLNAFVQIPLQGVNFGSLSSELTDKHLDMIIQKSRNLLISLTLTHAKITDKALEASMTQCMFLATLHLESLVAITYIGKKGILSLSPLSIPHLTKLILKNMPNLHSVFLEAPRLQHLDMKEGCTDLKNIHLSPHPLICFSAKQPEEFEYQIAKLYLLGLGVSKNLNQAYYWARLARHPLSAIVHYTLFNCYSVSPINGVHENTGIVKAIESLCTKEMLGFIHDITKSKVKALDLQGPHSIEDSILLSFILSVPGVFGVLQYLTLYGNNIGDSGVLLLSDVLKSNNILKHLNLWDNRIGDVGAIALSNSLKSNNVLQRLDLWSNKIGDMGAVALAESLKVNKTLECLNLVDNEIDDAGALALIEVLRKKTLQCLYLAGNRIDRQIMKMLNITLSNYQFTYDILQRGFLKEEKDAINLNAHHKTQAILKFLKLVTEGAQDEAEAMLIENPGLALEEGDVVDLSKRMFRSITGFQYAVWALDWHMWKMIRKYLSDEKALMQAQRFETGSWVQDYGKDAVGILNNLIAAYQRLFIRSNSLNFYDLDVMRVQLSLPVHVINEYCHPTRPFYPCPKFDEVSIFPRNRQTDKGEWFIINCQRYFCFLRGEMSRAVLGRMEDRVASGPDHDLYTVVFVDTVSRRGDPNLRDTDLFHSLVQQDLKTILKLTYIRKAQREELINELNVKKMQREMTCVPKGPVVMHYKQKAPLLEQKTMIFSQIYSTSVDNRALPLNKKVIAPKNQP
jgi:Leucine Rich repeat